MNKIILTLFLVMTTLFCKSQDTIQDLPRYLVENGDTIGIVLSVEQAQKLDNDVELLQLFEKMKINCDSLDMYYVKIINSLEQKVALLEVQKKDLIKQGKEKDKVISEIQEALNNCEKKNKICDEELALKDEEIKILKKEVFRQKVKKIVSVCGNVALAIVTTIIIIKS